jgi:hypothetical protein
MATREDTEGPLREERVLVTRATGFIGRRLWYRDRLPSLLALYAASEAI